MDVRFTRDAAKAIAKSPKRALLRAKIDQLARNPDSLAANIKRLKGREDSRLRVQELRVIFVIADGTLYIKAVLPRGSAYEEAL